MVSVSPSTQNQQRKWRQLFKADLHLVHKPIIPYPAPGTKRENEHPGVHDNTLCLEGSVMSDKQSVKLLNRKKETFPQSRSTQKRFLFKFICILRWADVYLPSLSFSLLFLNSVSIFTASFLGLRLSMAFGWVTRWSVWCVSLLCLDSLSQALAVHAFNCGGGHTGITERARRMVTKYSPCADLNNYAFNYAWLKHSMLC